LRELQSARPSFRGPRRPEDPIRDVLVCNEQIKHPEVRVVGMDGEALGIMPGWKALKLAKDQFLDLVEIIASAAPPVVRITDINKWVYNLKKDKKEQEKKARQNVIVVKEIQLRPVTDKHDLDVKLTHAKEFLADDNKIRIVIKFKGRELSFSDKGFVMMQEFIAGLGPCKIEKSPELSGRSIMAIIAPIGKNS